MHHIVTSSDGIQFVVQSDARTVAFDLAFALRKTAAELRAHGDFQELKSLDDLLAPEHVFEAPAPAPEPARIRVTLILIRGGKPEPKFFGE